MQTGMVLMLVGVSAAGKTTVQKELVERTRWTPIISYTTRQPRDCEVDGVDYHFVTEREFELLHPSMCEAAEVHGHKYGRPADDIEACLNEGRIGIMTIDHQGAKAMKERFGSRMKAVFLHISKTEQRVRLIERGTDSPESIERRCAAYDVESHGGCDIANLMITNTDKEWTIRRVINYAEGK